MSTIKVDNLQTTGGAGLYPARAWVNFNGTGTVAILADGNVSSITDSGTGFYAVNFSSSLTDANYSNQGSAIGTSNTSGTGYTNTISNRDSSNAVKTTSSVSFISVRNNDQLILDINNINISVVR